MADRRSGAGATIELGDAGEPEHSSSSISVELSSSNTATEPVVSAKPRSHSLSQSTEAPLNLEQESAGIALLECEQRHSHFHRTTQALFLVLCCVCTVLVVGILVMGAVQSSNVRQYSHDFSLLQHCIHMFGAHSRMVVTGAFRVLGTQPNNDFIFYLPNVAPLLTKAFKDEVVAFEQLTQDGEALLRHDDARLDAVAVDVLRELHDTALDFRVTADQAWDTAEQGDYTRAVAMIEEGAQGAMSELSRFYELIQEAQTLVFADAQNAEDEARQWQIVELIATIVMIVFLSAGVLAIVYRSRVETVFARETQAALVSCRQADEKAFMKPRTKRVASLSSSSAVSVSSDDALTLVPESRNVLRLRHVRRTLRIMFGVFVVACLLCSVTTLVALQRGQVALRDTHVTKALYDWGVLKTMLSYLHSSTVMSVVVGVPLPALKWMHQVVDQYVPAVRRLHLVTCDHSHKGPLFTLSPLDCGAPPEHEQTTECSLSGFSEEFRTVATDAVLFSLNALTMGMALLVGVTGRLGEKQWLDSDAEITAAMGAGFSTPSGTVTCFTCANRWLQSPECPDQLVEALWYVSDAQAGQGMYQDSGVAKLGFEWFTKVGFAVSPDVFEDMSSAKLMRTLRLLSVQDATFANSTNNAHDKFLEFLQLSNTLQTEEVDAVDRLEMVSTVSSVVFLCIIVLGCVLIFYQERRRQARQVVVQREQEWGLKRILHCPGAVRLLAEFASISYSEENVLFYRRVVQLKRDRWPRHQAHSVYQEFVRTGAEREINISVESREAIAQFMDTSKQMEAGAVVTSGELGGRLTREQHRHFVSAQRDVFSLLATNQHAQFVQWPKFQNYTHQRSAVLQRKMIQHQ